MNTQGAHWLVFGQPTTASTSAMRVGGGGHSLAFDVVAPDEVQRLQGVGAANLVSVSPG